jgi:hypothetical protein
MMTGGSVKAGIDRGKRSGWRPIDIFYVQSNGAGFACFVTIERIQPTENAMAARKKTWQEKLQDSKGLPKTGRVEGAMRRTWGEGTMVIPAPIDVDSVMRQVRKGRLTTINEIRMHLARSHRVDICCPITTGIFAWIASHAAQEAEDAGARRITPWWRTLKSSGELNPKYPGGIERQRARLEAEGHTIARKGQRFFVEGFERSLAKLAR